MPRSDPDDLARRVQAGIERGLSVLDSFRGVRGFAEADRMERAHRLAMADYDKRQRRYTARLAALRRRRVGGAVIGGLAAVIGLVDAGLTILSVGTLGIGPVWMWGIIAGVSGLSAFTAHRELGTITPPELPSVPVPPPPPLPRGAIGAEESERLTRLRSQVAQVIPAIAQLHPGAAAEVRRADAEAAPVLAGQVHRLALLHRMVAEMPGTEPARAASAAATEVCARLARGCATYESLLAAAATLLAAPDIARSTEDVLNPAVQAMTAYAHGLARAAGDV